MQGVGPQGGSSWTSSSTVTPKTETPSSCHGYSARRNPSHVHKAISIDEDASCIAENARLNAIQTPTTNNNSLRQDLGKVNFSPSPFHRTTLLLLPTHNSTVVAQVKASKVAKAAAAAPAPHHHHSVVIDDSSQRSISHGLKGPLKPVPFVPRNLLEVAPDEQSEIVGGHSSAASALRIHRSHAQCHNHQASKSAGLKANNGKACNINNCYDEEEEEDDDASLPESSSVCSLVASNYNTNLCSRKKHDDYSTYSLSDVSETL